MKTEQMQVDSTKFSGRLVQNGNRGPGKGLCIDRTKNAPQFGGAYRQEELKKQKE